MFNNNYGSNSTNNMNNQQQYDYNQFGSQVNPMYSEGGYNQQGNNYNNPTGMTGGHNNNNMSNNNMNTHLNPQYNQGSSNTGWGNNQFVENNDWAGTNTGNPGVTNYSEAPDNVNNRKKFLSRLRKGTKPNINVPENEKLGDNNETLTEKYIKNSLLLGKQDLYNPLNPDPMKSLFFRLHVTGVIESATVNIT
jgi:hypothetical protein